MKLTPSMHAGDRGKPNGEQIGFEAAEALSGGDPVTISANDEVSLAGDGDFVAGFASKDYEAGDRVTVRTDFAVANVADGVTAGTGLEATADNVLAALPGDGSGTQNRLRAVTDANDGVAVVKRF